MSSELRKTDVFMEFFDMITEYNEDMVELHATELGEEASQQPKEKPEEKTMLFYSPFCPFSRTVCLFLLQVW